MNKLGKSGAILMIIGSAFMLLFSIAAIFTGGILASALTDINSISQKVVNTTIIILAIVAFGFGIVNIILASLVLSGNKNLVITTGVLGLVSLLFGWFTYIIPAVLLLVGAILLFCSTSSKNKSRETVVEIKTVQSEVNA